MSTIESGLYQLGRIDQLASLDTPVHRIDPRAKVITTLVFLVCVVSFGKYELLPMLPFAIYPIVLAGEGDIPLGYIGTRLLIASPFAVVIGMFNPLLGPGRHRADRRCRGDGRLGLVRSRSWSGSSSRPPPHSFSSAPPA